MIVTINEGNEITGFQNFAKLFSMPKEFGQIEIAPNTSGTIDLGAGIADKMESVYSAAAKKRGITVDEVKDDVQAILVKAQELTKRIMPSIENASTEANSPVIEEDRKKLKELLEGALAEVVSIRKEMAKALCLHVMEGDN